MSVNVKKVLQDKPGSFLGYFLPLLILSTDNDKLLDVVELFGLDQLSECVERLGGSTVSFPTWETVDALVCDAYLLYLLDKKTAPKILAETFDSPYGALCARAEALRGTLKMERMKFPGADAAKRWKRRLQRVHSEIKAEANVN